MISCVLSRPSLPLLWLLPWSLLGPHFLSHTLQFSLTILFCKKREGCREPALQASLKIAACVVFFPFLSHNQSFCLAARSCQPSLQAGSRTRLRIRSKALLGVVSALTLPLPRLSGTTFSPSRRSKGSFLRLLGFLLRGKSRVLDLGYSLTQHIPVFICAELLSCSTQPMCSHPSGFFPLSPFSPHPRAWDCCCLSARSDLQTSQEIAGIVTLHLAGFHCSTRNPALGEGSSLTGLQAWPG